MAWTKLGVVLPLGAAGQFDVDGGREPTPLLVDGRVLLYYTGYDGSSDRIGVAGSDDGVHFTKLGVAVPLGAAGQFDDVHAHGPAPLLLDGRLLLYYAGFDETSWRVGVAGSDDGIHFTKLGVVIPLGGAGEFDGAYTYNPTPLLLDGRVLLYYAGFVAGVWRIGVAGSDDGIHFTKLGVVIPLGGAGEFDNEHAYGPAPLFLDGRILLYYAGNVAGVWRVGVAGSDDGIHFTKLGVVIQRGGAGEFDDAYTHGPAPLLLDGRILLYYAGYDGLRDRVSLAASDEGI